MSLSFISASLTGSKLCAAVARATSPGQPVMTGLGYSGEGIYKLLVISHWQTYSKASLREKCVERNASRSENWKFIPFFKFSWNEMEFLLVTEWPWNLGSFLKHCNL